MRTRRTWASDEAKAAYYNRRFLALCRQVRDISHRYTKARYTEDGGAPLVRTLYSEYLRLQRDRNYVLDKRQAIAARFSRALLEEHLSPEQSLSLANHGWFEVEGNWSNLMYRLDGGGGVSCEREMETQVECPGGCGCEIEETREVTVSYCIDFQESGLPDYDKVLAFKVMLETNEDSFTETAIGSW